MEIVNLVIFIVFILLLALFVFDSVRLRIVNRNLFSKLVQAEIDKNTLADKLNKTVMEKDAEKSDGFLRFVSESRDWAFQYIEKVQIAIKNFQDVFHPFAVQYYEKKKTRITKEEFQTIADAYRELVERLPDEGKK